MKKIVSVLMSAMLIVMSSLTALAETKTDSTVSVNQNEVSVNEEVDYSLMENQLEVFLAAKDVNEGQWYDFETSSFLKDYVKYYCANVYEKDAKEYQDEEGLFVKLTQEELDFIVNSLYGCEEKAVDDNIAKKHGEGYIINVDDIINDYSVRFVAENNDEYSFEYINDVNGEAGTIVVSAEPFEDTLIVSSVVSNTVTQKAKVSEDAVTQGNSAASVTTEETIDETAEKTQSTLSSTPWSFTGVNFTSQLEYVVGDTITISPKTTGTGKGVLYKYVYGNDNWSKWGVIRGFSEATSVNFKLPAAGTYNLYIDALVNDKVTTKTATIKILSVNDSWNVTNVNVSSSKSVYNVGDTVTISPVTTGRSANVQYKYVYGDDNWSKWGVIKGFSPDKSATFKLPYTGKFNIYVDAFYKDKVVSKSKSINILAANVDWSFNGISATSKSSYYTGDTVTITPNVTGNKSDVLYKYVYYRNSWSDWGVMKQFSNATSADLRFTKPGKYVFFVDALKNDVVTTKSIEINVSSAWNNLSVTASNNTFKLGNSVKLTSNISGSTYGALYKFVYMYNDWKQWGVIQHFSGNPSLTFKPPYSGKCIVYCDVLCNDTIQTKSVTLNVYQDVSVSLSNSSVSIPQGKSFYLKKTVTPSNASVKFVSTNTNVATVDSANKGYIYAKGTGSATINAVDSETGVTLASCAVKVTASEPIRFAYSSPNCAPKGTNVTLYATTDTSRTGVYFTVGGTQYNAAVSSTENNVKIWKATVPASKLSTGTTAVKAYSKTSSGSYSTCSAGSTTIYVTSATSTTARSSEHRRMSDAGITFLKKMEGYVGGSVYEDAGGSPTIGYGNLLTAGEQFYNNYIETEATAEMLDLVNNGGYASEVSKMLVDNKIKYNQHQFDALVSYSYNKGYSWATQWYENTYPDRAQLRKHIRSIASKDLGNMTTAEKNTFINLFNSAHSLAVNGTCLQGLVYRRVAELEIFFDNDYTGGYSDAMKNSPYYVYSCNKCNYWK